MSEKKSQDHADFVLKHRIAGAAFLLFFATLILPWLMGGPNQSSVETTSAASETQAVTTDEVNIDIEQELLDAIQGEQVVESEQVYVSRITPLDASKDTSESDDTSSSKPESKPEKSKPVEKQTPPVTKKDSSTTNKKKVEEKPVSKQTQSDSKQASKKEQETVKKPAEKQKEETKPDTKPVVKAEPEKAVEVGWIVSVGVFSNKANVTAIMKDLKQKGFSSSMTEIDTNKGKATRVWLGPFESRVDAAKAKTRLKDKTGEPGLIKAYP